MTKGLRKKALERLLGRHFGGDAHISTSGRGYATHDSQPHDTGCGDAPHDVETQADPTQHAEIPSLPHADVLEERKFVPYSTAVEAAALPPDSITDQRVHGPAKVKEDWDSYHALRPIAQHRYEQARRRCLELKGTGRPPRRGRSATREQSFIPDINRRAVIRWENGVSVGAFANAFNNFLAALARRHDFFNIFLTWKSQRIDALVACWRYICRFFFLDDNICAWTYCFAQINLSFKRWRLQVKKKYFVQITEDWERFWHLDERVDGVDFFVLCDYWDTAVIQAQAKIVRRNRNMPRSYEHHGGSRSFSQHYHQLELEEKLHAKVQEQMSQSQVGSNTLARLSREEDSIIETVIGPSRKNRYQWRGSEQRPHESSSTCESAAPPRTPGSSSYQDSMEQRLKAIEDWQSQQTTYQRIAEEERRRREQRELEFTQFISTLPQEAQEAYRRRFMSDQAGTSTQGAAGGSHSAAGVEDDDDDQED